MENELSLADELKQHLNEATETEEAPAAVIADEVTSTEETPAETGRVRDEHGRFTKTEEQAAEKPAEPAAQEQSAEQPTQEAQPTDPQIATNRPPATWSATAKAEFDKLPEVVRREIAKREQDFAKGIQQHAERAKVADKYLAEFQPYEHMFRSLGATHDQFLRQSLATEYRLRTASPQEKTQMLLQYAQNYGADLSILPQLLGVTEGGEQNNIQALVNQALQQHVVPLNQKIQAWEQRNQQASQMQEMQLEQEITGQIEAFQNATDESGNLKHLYYENVRGAMSALIGSGQAKTLEDAYDMACYANPEVRTALIAKQQSEAETKRLEEARRKADEAKRASFDVTGQGGIGIADASKLSLRDELASRLQGGAARL